MIKSPCINVCILDSDSGLCLGCCRYEDEIFNWMNFTEEQKKTILTKIKKRVISNAVRKDN